MSWLKFKAVLLFFLLAVRMSLLAEIAVSQVQKQQFAAYGIEVIVENYTKSDSGKTLTQQDLDGDLNAILAHFKEVGSKYVMMSNCRTIVLRGSHPKVAFANNSKLNFKYRTTGAIRHELFHNFDPFKFAYRYWKSLNNPKFFYVGAGRKGFFPNASNKEILHTFSSMSEFENDFTWSYAQTNAREDVASIFNHTTDPKTTDKWRKKFETSRIFRKKFFTLIGNCIEATGEQYWNTLYHFSPEEWNEIKGCRINLTAHTHISFDYTKSDLKRYGAQIRTSMSLMNLDSKLLRAAKIHGISFSQPGTPPKWQGSQLIVNDRDVNGLLENVFIRLSKNNPTRMKHCGLNGNINEWAILFRRVVLDVRGTAIEMTKNTELSNRILKLRQFTMPWLPEEFWHEIMNYQQEIKEDRLDWQRFHSCGFMLNEPLPPSVVGTPCQKAEIDNATKLLAACCSVLSKDFLRKTGIHRISYAKEMRGPNGKIIGGYVVGDTLCLDPTFNCLGRTVFYEFFKKYDPSANAIHHEWDQLKCSRSDYISKLARKSSCDDRAETFAWLLWNPCHSFRLAKSSSPLQKKMELILSLPILTDNAPERLNLPYYRRIVEAETSVPE